jgi:signal transduction histidine kinase/CHASE1-domain containing sensor protein
MSTMLRDAFSPTRVSFWVGTLLSSVVGIALYAFTQRSIESDAQTRFTNHARYAQNVISVRIKSYTDLLRATGSLMQSSANITRRQFHAYIRGLKLDEHYPAVDYINYAMLVRGDQRQAFVQDLRSEIQRFLPPDAAPLDIKPPGLRPAYLLVSYLEPEAQRPDLYGYDLMTNRYFGSLLLQERDDGKVHAAGTPILALSRPNDNYLGMRLPVYRTAAPTGNVEQRRAAYIGSLGLAFSLRKLLHGVLEEIPIQGMRMTVYDLGAGIDINGRDATGKPLTLFDSLGTTANPKPQLDSGSDVFSTTLPLDFNGCPWEVVYSVRKSAMSTEFDDSYPKMVMAFGFIASMLVYALLYTLTSSRRAALTLAQEMTSELRESQSKLQLSHQKLRRLADHAYQIKELERKRIAREIHDDLGQSLLALRIEAELLASRTKGTHGTLHKRARATLAQIDTTIKSVRQIINDLRPTVLDLGLSAAVEWQVNQFERRTGIQCELHDDHGEITLPDYSATAFFRILQESLTNIVRHANATKAVVELRLNAGWLSLTVRDNGCGLPEGGRNNNDSFGLVGIEERILILGGTCAVFSEPGGGTTVMVSAPVAALQDSMPPQEHEHDHEHASGSTII